MSTEWMSDREAVGRSSGKGRIMKASGVGVRITTLGLALVTKGHPNFINQLNPIMIDMGSTGHSNLVLFTILLVLIIPTTMSMVASSATPTLMAIPLFWKFGPVLCNAILIMRLIAMIELMISTANKTCSDLRMNN